MKGEPIKDLNIESITITLCDEMIQMVNDELNVTFTTVSSLNDIKKAFENNKNIEYDSQSYVGYTIINSLLYAIKNDGREVFKVSLKKPAEVIELISGDEKKAVAYAIKNMPDEVALNCIGAFPQYEVGKVYRVDDRFQWKKDGRSKVGLYRVIQPHTSQIDWVPDSTTSLYVQIEDPSIEYPKFVQPTGAHDAYKKGDKVTYKEKHYISLIDSNTWSPEAYPQGWKES